MFVNIIESYRNVVAVCDKELLGKIFEDGKFQLNVKENFYRGEFVGEVELLKILRKMILEDSTFNIVGEKSVRIALEAGVASKDEVGRINGIPFIICLI